MEDLPAARHVGGPGQDLALAVGFNVMLFFDQFVSDPSSALYKQAFLPSWPDEFGSDVKNGTLLGGVLDGAAAGRLRTPTARPQRREVRSQVLDAGDEPDVAAKTVVFLVYDENGAFFDHVAPVTAPAGTEGEYLTADPLPELARGTDGPIGLGFRTPAMVISPFSRGGWVNSDRFDHTSVLRFLEKRFDVTAPNITDWRRQTVGDLTSTLDLGSPDTSMPTLPATAVVNGSTSPDCPTATEVTKFLAPGEALKIPTDQTMPTQEAGTAKRGGAIPSRPDGVGPGWSRPGWSPPTTVSCASTLVSDRPRRRPAELGGDANAMTGSCKGRRSSRSASQKAS